MYTGWSVVWTMSSFGKGNIRTGKQGYKFSLSAMVSGLVVGFSQGLALFCLEFPCLLSLSLTSTLSFEYSYLSLFLVQASVLIELLWLLVNGSFNHFILLWNVMNHVSVI